jgi:Cu2+-exporting ATPase
MKRILFIMLFAGFLIAPVIAQDASKKDPKETVTFVVKNMDCENCVKKIEKNIAFERGVTDLKCELPSKTVKVTYRTDRTTEAKLVAAFKKIGYEAEAKADARKPH